MSDTPISTLDKRLHQQLEKARASIGQGNPKYAIDFATSLLKKHPGCVEVRQTLRDAQRALAAGKRNLLGGLLSSIPLAKIGEMTTRKDPAKGMQKAEQLLTQNPDNVQGHRLLGTSATALELYHTAVFAYECARQINPRDVENLKALARAYLAADNAAEAIKVCDQALKLAPGDGDLQDIVKKASVSQSMQKGRWEEEGDFRSKLKDEGEATKLEQQSRATTSEESIQELIADTEQKIESEPDNLNNYRQLARYHHQLKQFDKAIKAIQEGRKLEAGRADTGMERLESRYRRELVESRIATKRKELEKDPSNESLKAEIEAMEKEQAENLLKEAAETVRRYPNDYEARFIYGERLLRAGKIDDAIQQLQNSIRNPKVRLQALLRLGQAYQEKKFFDLAAQQFETAKSEAGPMNDTKKAVIYQLGQCYELMGDEERAIEEFKTIYASDIGFRDVSKKIDAYYEARNQ